MGLLDMLKKKEKPQETEQIMHQKQELPYDIDFKVNEEGKLQIDFFDKRAEFRQFYDTTRLIIDNEITNMGETPIKQCRVSWYEKDGAIMFDRNGKDISRRAQYKDILADIDIRLLQTDSNYCTAVMKNLLNRTRVEKYMQDGLKEQPDVMCGNYVGGIKLIENQYKKYFDIQVGKASHNSLEMMNRRKRYRESQEIAKQQQIRERQEKIQKLQSEIDDLSK